MRNEDVQVSWRSLIGSRPFVLPVLGLVSGIAFHGLVGDGWPWDQVSFLGVGLALWLIHMSGSKSQISEKLALSKPWLLGVGWPLLFFFVGMWISHLELAAKPRLHADILGKPVLLTGHVERILGREGQSFVFEIDSIHQQSQSYATNGRVLLRISSDGVQHLMPGMGLRLGVKLYQLDSTLNTRFLRYLVQVGVEAQGQPYFQDAWPLADRTLMYGVSSVREEFISQTDKLALRPDVEAMVDALVWGWRADLPEGSSEVYADAGVAHLLALSGLQLGYIMFLVDWGLLALFWIIYRLSGFPIGRRVRLWILLFTLPVYAILTGGSPAILRALLMAEVHLISQLYYKQGSIFNTLAFIAFVLLVIRPSWLADIGFQLTFTALVGVVWVPDLVNDIWPLYRGFWLMRALDGGLRSLLIGTASAQLFVAPVIIYHFDTFPTYFVVANFIAIPLSGLLTFGGFLAIAFADVPVLGNGFAALLDIVGSWQQAAVYHIARWPGAVLDFGDVKWWAIASNILVIIILLVVLHFLRFRRSLRVVASDNSL